VGSDSEKNFPGDIPKKAKTATKSKEKYEYMIYSKKDMT
jgi:hypothetical protein